MTREINSQEDFLQWFFKGKKNSCPGKGAICTAKDESNSISSNISLLQIPPRSR